MASPGLSRACSRAGASRRGATTSMYCGYSRRSASSIRLERLGELGFPAGLAGGGRKRAFVFSVVEAFLHAVPLAHCGQPIEQPVALRLQGAEMLALCVLADLGLPQHLAENAALRQRGDGKSLAIVTVGGFLLMQPQQQAGQFAVDLQKLADDALPQLLRQAARLRKQLLRRLDGLAVGRQRFLQTALLDQKAAIALSEARQRKRRAVAAGEIDGAAMPALGLGRVALRFQGQRQHRHRTGRRFDALAGALDQLLGGGPQFRNCLGAVLQQENMAELVARARRQPVRRAVQLLLQAQRLAQAALRCGEVVLLHLQAAEEKQRAGTRLAHGGLSAPVGQGHGFFEQRCGIALAAHVAQHVGGVGKDARLQRRFVFRQTLGPGQRLPQRRFGFPRRPSLKRACP